MPNFTPSVQGWGRGARNTEHFEIFMQLRNINARRGVPLRDFYEILKNLWAGGALLAARMGTKKLGIFLYFFVRHAFERQSLKTRLGHEGVSTQK